MIMLGFANSGNVSQLFVKLASRPNACLLEFTIPFVEFHNDNIHPLDSESSLKTRPNRWVQLSGMGNVDIRGIGDRGRSNVCSKLHTQYNLWRSIEQFDEHVRAEGGLDHM